MICVRSTITNKFMYVSFDHVYAVSSADDWKTCQLFFINGEIISVVYDTGWALKVFK